MAPPSRIPPQCLVLPRGAAFVFPAFSFVSSLNYLKYAPENKSSWYHMYVQMTCYCAQPRLPEGGAGGGVGCWHRVDTIPGLHVNATIHYDNQMGP